jgi:hypothetical protein
MAELRQPPLPTLGRGWIPWAALALAAGLAGMLLVSYDRHRLPKVEFALDMPNASSVTLVGDFNNWSPEATPLSKGSQDAGPPGSPWRRDATSSPSSSMANAGFPIRPAPRSRRFW